LVKVAAQKMYEIKYHSLSANSIIVSAR